jgi:hypothetical protein
VFLIHATWQAPGSPQVSGVELIAAGLLMLAGAVDLDELDRWMRIGWERRRGASVPYPDDEDQSKI